VKRLAAIAAAATLCVATPATAATTLHVGSRGAAVRTLQERLGVPADGIFGQRTARAVRRFQRARGLKVSGRVDRATRTALGLGTPVSSDITGGADADAEPAAPVAPVVTPPAPPATAASMVEAARTRIGSPYAAGATGPASFDCSGLVVWAARAVGITTLPRSSFAQYDAGTPVARGQVQAGDLVFFDTAGPGPSDVGIASGPATVISATTHGVREHDLGGTYWGAHFVGARRLG
jgi:cell wall-associated NlpC family hydrolase